jgi:methyltransferase (TIGR00027 family)
MHDKKPSSTSIVVALGTLCAAQDCRHVDVDPRIKTLLKALLKHAPLPFSVLAYSSNLRPIRRLLETTMSFIIPGMFSHYLARKVFIETRVRNEVRNGCMQIVVIGGGLDTLSFRIKNDFPSVRCIEIDHPSTHSLKKRAVSSIHLLSSDVELISADLSQQRISEVLMQSTYQADTPTLFIIEGVLMYLTESNVRTTLTDLTKLGSTKSLLILTCMETGDDGKPAFLGSKNHFVSRWLKQNREPFLWGLKKDQVQSFFISSGLNVKQISQRADMHELASALPSWFAPPADGEFVVILGFTAPNAVSSQTE